MANFSHFYALCPFSLLKLKFNNPAAEIFMRYSYSAVIKTGIISTYSYCKEISYYKGFLRDLHSSVSDLFSKNSLRQEIINFNNSKMFNLST